VMASVGFHAVIVTQSNFNSMNIELLKYALALPSPLF
jgi:hypothetical protein